MVLQLLFVPADLAVQLVHQLIDGGVEVFGGLFNEDVAAFDVQGDFSFLSTFFFLLLFHSEQDVDVNDLVKVTGHPVELGEDVFTQSWRYFKMVATDRQVHRRSFHRTGN